RSSARDDKFGLALHRHDIRRAYLRPIETGVFTGLNFSAESPTGSGRKDRVSIEILSERLSELYTPFKLPHYPHPLLLTPRRRSRGQHWNRPRKILQRSNIDEEHPWMVAYPPTCLQPSALPRGEAASGAGSAPARGAEPSDDAEGRADFSRRRDASADQPVPSDRRALS